MNKEIRTLVEKGTGVTDLCLSFYIHIFMYIWQYKNA